jgi:peptidoglycan-associated lipoprotein
MKRAAFYYLLVIGLMLSVSVTGCKHSPTGITTIPGHRQPPPGGPGADGPLGVGGVYNPGDVGAIDLSIPQLRPNWLENAIEDRDTFAANTVYFDFDSASVKASEGPKLQEVASYLQTNPIGDLMVEGHCDERGTDGYNDALGERRAQAVREYLVNLGVNPNRLHTISYGRSKPAVDGRTEAAYSKNRRGELVLLLPAQ